MSSSSGIEHQLLMIFHSSFVALTALSDTEASAKVFTTSDHSEPASSPSSTSSSELLTLIQRVLSVLNALQHHKQQQQPSIQNALQPLISSTASYLLSTPPTIITPMSIQLCEVIKVAVRYRIDCAELVTPEFIEWLTIATTAGNSEASRLLLNLLALQYQVVLPRINDQVALGNWLLVEISTFQGDVVVVDGQTYIYLRLLFYLTTDNKTTTSLVNQHDAYEVLMRLFAVCVHIVLQNDPSSTLSIAARQLIAFTCKVLLNLVSNASLWPRQQLLRSTIGCEFAEAYTQLLAYAVEMPAYVTWLLSNDASNTQHCETDIRSFCRTYEDDLHNHNLEMSNLALQDTSAAAQPSLQATKLNALSLLLYTAPHLSQTVSNEPRALQAISNLLHQSAILGTQQKAHIESALAPVACAVQAMATHSPIARRFVKICIFHQHAELDKSAQQNRMLPAGAMNERDVDADPLTLRGLLLRQCTSLILTLKHSVSELLWTVCDEDATEFVRLCGFGRAAGWLQVKGFAQMQPQHHTTART